jgi:hypothetical protein
MATDQTSSNWQATEMQRKAGAMTRELIFVIEEAPEGGYTAQALGYSIYTEADTWEELRGAAQDAVACHFDDERKPCDHPPA